MPEDAVDPGLPPPATLQSGSTLQSLQAELAQAQQRAALLEERLRSRGVPQPALPPIHSSYPPHAYPAPQPQQLYMPHPQVHYQMQPPPPPAPAQPDQKRELPADPFAAAIGSWVPIAKTWLLMIFSTALYLVVGSSIYVNVEGWSIIQSVYFCMVTMSTVGYGDLSPSRDESKVITIFMIVIGVVAIFSQVGAALSTVIDPITLGGRQLLDKCCPRKMIDIDGDGEADFSYPRHWIVYYFKGLVPSLLLNMVVQLISAAIFVALEGWTYGDAIYHCIVTATTVGYGDVKIATDGGMLWACFHILISVVLLAEGISTIGELQSTRKEELQRLEQLKRKLDANMLDGLLDCSALLRDGSQRAGTADPMSMSELEFVVAMLLQLGICKWSHVTPFLKKFRALDADGSGQLSKDDLNLLLSPDGPLPKGAPRDMQRMPTRASAGQFVWLPSMEAAPAPLTPSRMASVSFHAPPPMPPQQPSVQMAAQTYPPPQHGYNMNYAQYGYPAAGGAQMPPGSAYPPPPMYSYGR